MTDKEKLKVKEEVEKAFKQGYTKALLEEGKPVSEIAGRISMSASTIRAWKKKLGF